MKPIPPEIPACPAPSIDSTASYDWRPALGSARKSTVILVHGLNNKPSIMDQLGEALRASGFDVVRVGLSGHNEEADKHRVSESIWFGDLKRALCLSRDRWPQNHNNLLGFSLGGLLAAALTLHDSEIPVDHLILLAPALSLRCESLPIRALSSLACFDLAVPSLAPRRYRAFDSTSLRAYRTMFELESALYTLPAESRPGCSATLFISPADEVVSVRGLERWLARNRPRDWRLVKVYKDAGIRSYNHLLPVREALGPNAWRELTEKIIAALAE